MSLRLKTIIGIALIEAVLLLLLVTMTLNYLRSTNHEGIQKRADTTAHLFATTTKDAVLSYDLASLESFVHEVLISPDLVYARVLGPDNEVFVASGNAEVLKRSFVADVDLSDVQDGIYDVYANIEESGKVYGRVELGLDIDLLSKTISAVEQRSIFIAMMEMGLVALFSFILGTYLTRQLKELAKGAQSIADGELDIHIPIKGTDEIAQVAEAFNTMSTNLSEADQRRDQYEQKLHELNRTLEDKVAIRTQQLNDKNKQLQRANEEIKAAQARLLSSEKMASVGLLASGLAHEVNNPLSFVISNIDTLDEYAKNYRAAAVELEAMVKALKPDEASEERLHVTDLRDKYDMDFMDKDLDELLSDTQDGAVRIRDIVKSLKSFAHENQTEAFQQADINQCINSTLAVANNELKYHCTIEKDLQDIPLIYCKPGQINQVILNMLINAGQAIKEEGTIKIKTCVVDETLEISICDDGCGIEPEVVSKLFDPFFTTKPVGEGTGLGLSISYGIIVDDHNGDIRVESKLNEGSCFTIVLPLLTSPPDDED